MATFFKYTYMYCKIKFCVVLRSTNTYVYTVVCTNIFGKHVIAIKLCVKQI